MSRAISSVPLFSVSLRSILAALVVLALAAGAAWADERQATAVSPQTRAGQQTGGQQEAVRLEQGSQAETQQNGGGIGDGASATDAESAPQIAGRKRMTATRTPSPLVIDGFVNEPEWAMAEEVRDFMQRDPDNGQPGSERTVARVMFDEENIYLSFVLYDSQPDRITARDLRRDSPLRMGRPAG